MKSVVYLDVETQRTALDVGGWDDLSKLGVSVAVAFATHTHRLHVFMERDLESLRELLKSADLVVGFNSTAFDFKVLEICSGVAALPGTHLDLMTEIANLTGCRVGLRSLQEATLGTAPEVDGLDLVRLWKQGRVEKVIEGCCNDVLSIRDLHEHGVGRGEIFYFQDGSKKKTRVAVDWAERSPTRSPDFHPTKNNTHV